jgi:hypothetical protein
VIANTTKGAGSKVFENDPVWHSKKMNKLEYEMALIELKSREEN